MKQPKQSKELSIYNRKRLEVRDFLRDVVGIKEYGTGSLWARTKSIEEIDEDEIEYYSFSIILRAIMHALPENLDPWYYCCTLYDLTFQEARDEYYMKRLKNQISMLSEFERKRLIEILGD